MKKVQSKPLKTMDIRPSGRSTDYLSPSFIFGCGFNCSYCYCKRNIPDGVVYYDNVAEILSVINNHSWFADVVKPNQTDPDYVTYDIGCNTDIALHASKIPLDKIFQFFMDHPKAKASFATKYVNNNLLEYNPKQKVRIRFSLMPQRYSEILEPHTSSIQSRIDAIQPFIEAGYDVHINFSPVIVEDGWLKEYEQLFRMVDRITHKSHVKAEVIFLTHNEKKHAYNVNNGLLGEDLLWKPEIQEAKISQYGGENIRYNRFKKAEYIRQFLQLHDEIIPWNTIRYIF